MDVTEQVISRKTIDESQKQYRQIVEMAQEGIWVIDENKVTTFVNKKLADILGYTTDEIVGKEIFFFMDKKGLTRAKEFMKNKESVGVQQFHYKFLSKLGEEILTLISSNPLFDNAGAYIGSMAMLTDITEVKRSQELLRRSERRYRRLFEQNLAGIYQTTPDGVIVNCNNAFAKLLKYDSPEDIKSVNASALYFTNEERQHFVAKVNNNKNVHNYEVVAKCKDGTARPFLENVSVHIDPENGLEFFDGIIIDISEKKAAELSVSLALEEKNTILESIGDAFFALDQEWTVTYWNKHAEKLLHKTKSETVGNNLWVVFADSISSYSYAKYHEAIAKQEVMHFEDHYPTLNRWYEISAYPSERGLSVYFKDITNRKQISEAVRASEEVRKLIMDSAMDAIVCINAVGSITVWNPQAEKTFGWSEDEILGKLFSESIIPARYREQHNFEMTRYLQGGVGPMLRKPFEIEAVNAAGNEFPIEICIVPIKQVDVYFFCAFIRDISSRKSAEQKMSELNQNLLDQSKKLMMSNEELEKYAYVTSHDLQEPLRMVTSFLQLLQKKYESQLDDTARKYIRFAVDGAERMKTLIHDLLEFSRISSVEQAHQMVSLNEILFKTLMGLKGSIDETQAVVQVPPLPDVYGNGLQLSQLFQNLISNAIKYNASPTPVIEIDYDEDDLFWKFSVEDNGIGIDPQFYDKIFIIFQRLHNKKNYDGTGIGLAICKKIVELHDGRIWVKSSGSGTTFHFTLSKEVRHKNSISHLN